MKSRQLGMSEVGVMTMFYLCDIYSYDALKLLYAFPTLTAVKDFKKSRIDNQITSGYYKTIIDKYNNSLNQMSIRDSRVFFRTASKPSSLEGVDLNVIMYDEYERYAGGSGESSGEESLKSDNRYALIRRWSTPSSPDFGTDQKYKASDQRVWLIKCEHCGYEQEMDFNKNIEIINEDGIDHFIGDVKPGSTRYICQKCKQSLESSRWYNGHWVARYPKRDTAGFFISQLNAVWLTSDRIYSNYLKANSTQLFYNYTLGIPYQDTSLLLTDADILNNARKDLETDQTIRGTYPLIAVGIDWGQHYHHIVILGCRANGVWDIIHLQRIEKSIGVEHLEEDLRQVILTMYQFDPDIILPDIGYNGNYVDKLAAQFGTDKVYGVQVNSARTNNEIHAQFNETNHTVKIDKLMQNMQCLNELKTGRLGLFNNPRDPNFKLFINHWKNVLIIDQEDEKTKELVKVIKRKGDDHYAQACVYAYVGMKQLIEKIQNRKAAIQVSNLDVQSTTDDLAKHLKTKIPGSKPEQKAPDNPIYDQTLDEDAFY